MAAVRSEVNPEEEVAGQAATLRSSLTIADD